MPIISAHNAENNFFPATMILSNGVFRCLKRGEKRQQEAKNDVEQKPDDTDAFDNKDIIMCRACNYPITSINARIEVNEKHQHVYTNPHGYIFCIGCFAQAPGCLIAGPETDFFTWFPGYAWRSALCGQCWTMLGWHFRSRNSQFFGLIVDKLLFPDN